MSITYLDWLEFTPMQFGGAVMWLDASDASTITESGGSVSVWADKSGNGADMSQGTAALQPATGSETLNGMNVISSDGTDLMMSAAVSINPLLPIYAFQVAKYDDGACIFDATGVGRRLVWNQGIFGRETGAGLTTASDSSYGTTKNVAVCATFYHINGTTYDFTGREDGTVNFNLTVGSDFSDSVTLDNLYLFDDSTGGNTQIGYIAEVIVLNPASALDISQVQAIESYLMNKWGI